MGWCGRSYTSSLLHAGICLVGEKSLNWCGLKYVPVEADRCHTQKQSGSVEADRCHTQEHLTLGLNIVRFTVGTRDHRLLSLNSLD